MTELPGWYISSMIYDSYSIQLPWCTTEVVWLQCQKRRCAQKRDWDTKHHNFVSQSHTSFCMMQSFAMLKWPQILIFLNFHPMNKSVFQLFILIQSKSNSSHQVETPDFYFDPPLVKMWKGPAMQKLQHKVSNIARLPPKFFYVLFCSSAFFSDLGQVFQALLVSVPAL